MFCAGNILYIICDVVYAYKKWAVIFCDAYTENLSVDACPLNTNSAKYRIFLQVF